MKVDKTRMPSARRRLADEAVSRLEGQARAIPTDYGFGLDEGAAAAGSVESVPGTAQISASLLGGLGEASVVGRAVYVDAIMHAVPALADIFALAPPETVERALSERSTEELIAQIDAGRFFAEIARLWRVAMSDLNKWILDDPERFSRANLARKNQAALWDWVALQVLLHAPSDRVEIVRAEKIAQHCRWRAEVFNRDDYGQNIKVTQVDGRNARELTTQELEIIARGGVLPG